MKIKVMKNGMIRMIIWNRTVILDRRSKKIRWLIQH